MPARLGQTCQVSNDRDRIAHDLHLRVVSRLDAIRLLAEALQTVDRTQSDIRDCEALCVQGRCGVRRSPGGSRSVEPALKALDLGTNGSPV